MTASLPNLTASVAIYGQGMSASVVDGDGQWQMFQNALGSNVDVTIERLRMVAFDGAAIVTNDTNLTVSQLDIDGTGGTTTYAVQGGIGFLNLGSGGTRNFTANDVYIHDFAGTIDDSLVGGISVGVGAQGTANVEIHRLTTTRISNTGANTQVQAIGLMSGVLSGFSPGTINASIDNTTVSDLSSTDGTGTAGITISAGLNAGSATTTVNLAVTNSTITNIRGVENNILGNVHGASLMVATAAAQASDTVNVAINFRNTLLANKMEVPSENCGIGSFSPLVSGVGQENVTISSLGGNLSDDDSCATYFTQPTDQNNVTNLSLSLAALMDNGGYVPTMALLPNSPAIDSGVTVGSLTTDARLAIRPQGTAYDSGAYESPYAKASITESLAGTGENSLISLLIASAMLAVGSTFWVVRRSSTQP